MYIIRCLSIESNCNNPKIAPLTNSQAKEGEKLIIYEVVSAKKNSTQVLGLYPQRNAL